MDKNRETNLGDEAEWRSAFVRWYDVQNQACIDAKNSMGMLDELCRVFTSSTADERLWLIAIMTEWQTSGNECQKYDSRVLLTKFIELL